MSQTEAQGGNGLGALYTEHLLLNAVFDDDAIVSHYAGEPDPSLEDESDRAVLADLSSIQTLLFDGAEAKAFAHAAFAGKQLAVGECAYEAVLTGDGSLASVPLLARTGVNEYVVFDDSARSDVLAGWLSFLQSVEQNGYAPYAGLATTDATGSHTVLALWGASAQKVLLDYVKEGNLPSRGTLASCKLDNIPCIVVRPPCGHVDLYLVLVPPTLAVVLWRSLLSFTEVVPVGHAAVRKWFESWYPWYGALDSSDSLRLTARELLDYGLIRDTGDFVGARGLNSTDGFSNGGNAI